jgi:hypothetical protein
MVLLLTLIILENLEIPYSKIDFKPLYQTIHIHSFIQKREEFKQHFENNRKLQYEVIRCASVEIRHDFKDYEQFLCEIIGYFCIEWVVLTTTENFRSRTVVNEIIVTW